MPAETLVGDLAELAQLTGQVANDSVRYEPLERRHREQVARLYRYAYPPEIGAADEDEALAEMDAAYAGNYGQLISRASLVAVRDDQAIGSIQVVSQSPWDPDLDCPFIIELFVLPAARRHGIGRALLSRAATACMLRGETRLALRTGDGTSPAAHHLYRIAGMRRWPIDHGTTHGRTSSEPLR